MFIKKINFENFKSFRSTVIMTHFDPYLNVITGLNGSGKSNILDAICFVFGIVALSEIRVSCLSELVYNYGQFEISKGSVSIIFNNLDKNDGNCPLGYEEFDEISIYRQFVLDGKNKYLINGKNADLNQIQSLFHSVRLNINNPHFLIQQGRIIDFLDAKPNKILSMLEEAIGTKLFDIKTKLIEKTFEKKEKKLIISRNYFKMKFFLC